MIHPTCDYCYVNKYKLPIYDCVWFTISIISYTKSATGLKYFDFKLTMHSGTQES